MIFCNPSSSGGCDIATGDLYMDDGSTLDQRSVLINFKQNANILSVTTFDNQGFMPTDQRINQIEFYGYEQELKPYSQFTLLSGGDGSRGPIRTFNVNQFIKIQDINIAIEDLIK